MKEETFDLVIIGGGPGGYVAAIRAAQLGLKTACVEKRSTLGGTCLNVGCIPSKALLHSSERYAEACGPLTEHGIVCAGVELDLERMMARKSEIVDGLTKGVAHLLKKNGVTMLEGTGRISQVGEVVVESAAGDDQTLRTEHILIATGSSSMPLPGLDVDERRIVTSTGALALEAVPERLVVVGAGVIGLELGSVWSRLGASVQIIEFLDHILPGMDRETTKQAKRIIEKQGVEFKLETKVTAGRVEGARVLLTVEPSAGGEADTIESDVVLVAIGRCPYTEGLGLEALGVQLDARGYIQIDERYETTVPRIHAIGDCVPGPMLAHKAEDEGVACVELLAGQSAHVDANLIPGVVYTWPEIAGVGRTQEQLDEAGVAYSIGKFPFAANSRGRATGDTDGLVKILCDKGNGRVLGVHIVGPLAGDLLQEAVIAMEFGATAEDIARTCHAHPAMGEALKEAAMAAGGRAIHM